MTPEAIIILVNAIFLAFAYLWVYPSLPTKTVPLLIRYDLVINAAALFVAGLLFWGSGTAFNMVFFDANWAVFSILTMACMEMPAFAWFARKHDLDL